MATPYKTIGASVVAVATVVTTAVYMWWQQPVPAINAPRSQYEAEIMLAVKNRQAAMGRTTSYTLSYIGRINTAKSAARTNMLGCIRSADGYRWTSWDTNMTFQGSGTANPEEYTLSSALSRILPYPGLTAGWVPVTIHRYPNYWRTDTFGHSPYLTYWMGTNIAPIVLLPYRAASSFGGPYNQTNPEDPLYCGTIKIDYTAASNLIDTVGNEPVAPNQYAAGVKASLAPAGVTVIATHWLVPPDYWMTTGDWDGNWPYDPSTNTMDEVPQGNVAWTNWVTLPTRTVILATNTWTTNIVGVTTNIYRHQNSVTNVSLCNAWTNAGTIGGPGLAFERDQYTRTPWSTSVYNDLCRPLSMMQWQVSYVPSVVGRYYGLHFNLVRDQVSPFTYHTNQWFWYDQSTSSFGYVPDSECLFTITCTPGYYLAVDITGFILVHTNTLPFGLTNGYWWLPVPPGGWITNGVSVVPPNLVAVLATTNTYGKLPKNNNFFAAQAPTGNWSVPAYGITSSVAIGYETNYVFNTLVPDIISRWIALNDTTFGPSIVGADPTTWRGDSSWATWPYYLFGGTVYTYGSDRPHSTFRVQFNDVITNYTCFAPAR